MFEDFKAGISPINHGMICYVLYIYIYVYYTNCIL